MACSHQPPCSTLRIYHWERKFIAAQSVNTALEFVEAESLIEESQEFDPREVPADEIINVGVDADGCQCHDDDVIDDIGLTPEQWICRQREGDETGFIVGDEW